MGPGTPSRQNQAKVIRNNKYKEGLIDNALCRYLAHDPLLEGKALLKSAKYNLQKIDCVLFLDQFPEEIPRLFKLLGIEIEPQEIPKINTTEKEPVSAQLLEEVRQLNGWDIQLYQYAKIDKFCWQ